MELRDYQAEAIQNLRRSIRMGNRRPVLMASTGAGKTLMAAEIMRCAVEKGNRCLFVVDSLELVDQAIEAFQAMGLGVGVIQGHHWMTDYTHMVQVCTAQTLAARLKREREQLENYEVDLVFHDECYSADTELLTARGWVSFPELRSDEIVAQYDQHEKVLSWTKPSRVIERSYSGEMIHFYSERYVDLLVTPGHEILAISNRDGEARKVAADEFKPAGYKIKSCAPLVGDRKINITPEQRYLIAYQADGSLHNEGIQKNTHTFSFSKTRKIERFLDICEDCGYRVGETSCNRRSGDTRAKPRRRFMVYDMDKRITKKIHSHIPLGELDAESAAEILNEAMHWDGYLPPSPDSMYFSSTDESAVDFYQAVATLAGYSAIKSIQVDARSDKYSDVHRLYIAKEKSEFSGQSVKKSRIEYDGKVYCATVPKGNLVVRRNNRIAICGNCHVQHSIRDEMAAMYPHAPVIGLSATPFAKGMGKFYDDLIIAIPMADLIEQGYLCPFKVFAPSEPDLKGVPTGTNGDYHAESASQKYTPSLIADIVKTWKKHGAGRPTIGFACNVAHSKELAKQFQQAGINAAHIDGYGGSDEHKAHRFETVRAYKEGEIDVLWSVGVLTKGFDAPRTACIIDAQPTKSLSRHIQKWGRGLRIAYQKTDCLILDHAGNAQRNGFPTDELPDVLNTGEKGESKTDRKKKDEPLPKPCPKCSFVKPVGQHKCSNCGFAPEKPSGITVEDGELVEYRPTYTKVQKLSWLYQINHYRESHGYKPGWAIHKFREKFGEEPPVKWPKKTEQPTLEVIGWLRHQQIKFAKGRGRANAS